MVFSQILKSYKQKIRNVEEEFAKQLKSVKFPVYKNGFPKIEKQNIISISVFDYEDETPYQMYTPKPTFENRVSLLLL